jgi:RimJ/RimL family protein N-acetyltransferase
VEIASEASGAILETQRLRMRQFGESDWDAYALMCADPEVMRHIGTGVVLTRDEAWRSIAGVLGHWQLRGYGMWALESKETGEFIGRVGFIDPPGWPGFERVISLIRAANARSIRVAEALGETLAGDTQLLGSTSLVYEVRADIRAR